MLRPRRARKSRPARPLDIDIRPRGPLLVAVPLEAVPPLKSETVEETRRRVRRERAGG